MLGLSLGREYRDRVSSALAAAVQFFVGCVSPTYASNIREWDNSDEVTPGQFPITVTNYGGTEQISTPTGSVQFDYSFSSFFNDPNQDLVLDVGTYHGRDGVLRINFPDNSIERTWNFTLGQPLFYYGTNDLINYNHFWGGEQDYSATLSFSLYSEVDSDPAAPAGLLGWGPGQVGYVNNHQDIDSYTAGEWNEYSFTAPITAQGETGDEFASFRWGIIIPRSEETPWGPSGTWDQNYYLPAPTFYVSNVQFSICQTTNNAETPLSDPQQEVFDEGVDYFSGAGYSFAKTSGAIFTPSYASPHTWIPGEIGYQGLRVYGFTFAQWGAGTSNPPSAYYGFSSLPSGFSGVTTPVVRFENRIGTQTDRGFRLSLLPKDENQNYIDYSPFFNTDEYKHTIRIKFYIDTPSGVTYRPSLGLRYGFGTSPSDVAANEVVLDVSNYPLNQWNTLVIDQTLNGDETGTIGRFTLEGNYVMPGTTTDGTYASLGESQVNLYIAEASWQISDGPITTVGVGYPYAG